jgi:signal transduction histidine kinase
MRTRPASAFFRTKRRRDMAVQKSGRRRARALILAFGGLAVVLTLIGGLTVGISHESLRQVDEIASNALVSVELLGRMASDVYQQERVVEAHIFEATTANMEPWERQIDAIKADYSTAARAYEPLTTYPNERDAWHRLRTDVSRSDAPIAEALRLSRANRDAQAQEVLRNLEPIFDDISHDVAVSVGINTNHARAAHLEALRLHRELLIYLLVLWCVGIGLTLAIGIPVTRQFARAEERERLAFAVLEKRNHELDAFAARIAHDFRAPLASVRLAVSTLKLPSPDLEQTAALVDRGIGRMNAMIEDLLQLSQIDGGARTDVCDPSVAATALRENMAERLAEVGATMYVAVESAMIGCRAGLFQQVLSNLAENALKYRRQGIDPEIQISGRSVANRYELRPPSASTSRIASTELRSGPEPSGRGLHRRRRGGGRDAEVAQHVRRDLRGRQIMALEAIVLAGRAGALTAAVADGGASHPIVEGVGPVHAADVDDERAARRAISEHRRLLG